MPSNLHIRTKIRIKDLVYLQILIAIFLNIVTTDLHFPHFLAYLTDGLNVILLIWCARRMLSRVIATDIHRYIWPLYTLLAVLFVGVIINATSVPYIIWGFRNNFRFILFWLICISVFDESDEQRLFNILFNIFHVNAVFAFVQYFVLGLEQDFIGGIFGTIVGGNGLLNIFMCIVLCYTSAQYICKKCSLGKIGYVLITSILIAVFAELKFFYVEAIAIIGLTVLASKPSLKTFSVVIAGVITIFVGLQVLSVLDPHTFEIITNFERILDYANMEGGGYNISRLGAFATINRLFFHDSTLLNLFGFGLGNCDTSSFSLFNSLFYRQYGWLHYNWFSHQQWFLEGGYLGLGCVAFFFLMLVVYAVSKRYYLKEHRPLQTFSIVFPFILLMNLVYNNSIRIEIAYVSFACMAILPAIVRSEKEK